MSEVRQRNGTGSFARQDLRCWKREARDMAGRRTEVQHVDRCETRARPPAQCGNLLLRNLWLARKRSHLSSG